MLILCLSVSVTIVNWVTTVAQCPIILNIHTKNVLKKVSEIVKQLI